MLVLGSGINVQVVGVDRTAQTIFRKHTADGFFQYTLRVTLQQRLHSGKALAARVAGVADVFFIVNFISRETDFVRIDDNDLVACVRMRGKAWLVFATEDFCHFRSQTTYYLVLGIDQ